MRTFIRFLAFLAVFTSGVLLVVSGAMLLDSVQPPSSVPGNVSLPSAPSMAGQGTTVREILARSAPPPTPPTATSARWQDAPIIAEALPFAAVPPMRVIVPTGGTTELYDDLYISVSEKWDSSRVVAVTIGSSGWPSKRIDGMRVGDVAFYEGRRTVEVRLDASPTYDRTEFVVTEKPASTMASPREIKGFDLLERLRADQGPIPGYGLPQAPEHEQTVSGVLSVVMGLVLMLSATVLVAVRPKVRQMVGKPIAGRSASVPPRTQVSPSPVLVTIGGSQKQGEVTVSFEVVQGRDGKSVWRKVVARHWRYLQPGWTEDQVRQLLDGPIKVRPAKATTGEAVSVWHYYRYAFGHLGWGWVSSSKGTVTFKDGKVVGFAAPPLDYERWVAHTPNPEV